MIKWNIYGTSSVTETYPVIYRLYINYQLDALIIIYS